MNQEKEKQKRIEKRLKQASKRKRDQQRENQKEARKQRWQKRRKLYAVLGTVLALLVTIWLCFSAFSHQKQRADLPDRPRHSTVLDVDHHLSKDTINTIDNLNSGLADTKKQLQVGVYIADRLPFGDLEYFSNELFRKWKVGYKKTNNGVLVVIDIKDHKFRIETSNNVSTKLTDIEAKDILDSSRPYFRKKDYNGGTLYIVESITTSFYGEEPYNKSKEDKSFDAIIIGGTILLIILSFVIVFLMAFLLPDKWFKWLGGGSDWSDSSGGSSGGWSSGGGWSGGGGDGGGASSGW